jgi:hypothetical protein
VSVNGYEPTSVLTIDSTKVDPDKLKRLEDILYGADSGDGPRLPLPDEVATIVGTASSSTTSGGVQSTGK